MTGQKNMRVGVLASGGGSNFQALIEARCARLVALITNVPQAGCLERAAAAGIPTEVLDHKRFDSRQSYDAALLMVLRKHEVELVVLAGFMRILTPGLLREFPHRVVNVHPALLPSFPGIHASRQALEHGVKIAGCTVHLVDEGTDTGPIIAQAAVPVLDTDNEASLQLRIQVEEHRLFPKVVKALAEGRVTVSGRRVTIAGEQP